MIFPCIFVMENTHFANITHSNADETCIFFLTVQDLVGVRMLSFLVGGGTWHDPILQNILQYCKKICNFVSLGGARLGCKIFHNLCKIFCTAEGDGSAKGFCWRRFSFMCHVDVMGYPPAETSGRREKKHTKKIWKGKSYVWL